MRSEDRPPRAISVFVIDDDVETRALVSRILRTAGYSVRTASNGHEALGLMQWIEPAMILLDVHMPVMDGYAFREAQRHNAEWSQIPTIMMTADPTAEPIDGLQLLRKPLPVDDLIALAARFCPRVG